MRTRKESTKNKIIVVLRYKEDCQESVFDLRNFMVNVSCKYKTAMLHSLLSA